ncbi:MAG: hypothetical protein AB8B57_12035 [Congregibacter sp.]
MKVDKTMIPELDRSAAPNPYLEEQVQAGRLGFKSGQGFRTWTEEEQQTLRRQLSDHLLRARENRDGILN